MVTFKIYYVTDWKKIVSKHALPNILRSKDNQAMKFDHLVEYNMRNTFREKSYTKCGIDACPRLFYKKPTFSIKCCEVCFYCIPNSRFT